MNDGSPVRTVMIPLIRPTSIPKIRTRASMIHGLIPNRVVPIARIMELAPITEPIERSNSPAIIRTPTASAMIPSSAEVLSQAAVPFSETKSACQAVIAKKM